MQCPLLFSSTMNKLALLGLCSLFPIIAGSSTGSVRLKELYNPNILFDGATSKSISIDLREFAFKNFQDAGCNPKAEYKLMNQSTYQLNDLNGEKITVYKVEFRVFNEQNQNMFNGYDHGKKFRTREFTIHQSSEGLAMANMSCEDSGWQRKQI